jgi:hypothetical protein
MENSGDVYFKTDGSKVINGKYIRWIQKMDECLQVCNKSTGCSIDGGTHQICKLNNPDSYSKLNKLFE